MKCQGVVSVALAIFTVVARLSMAQLNLPDVIIGDPNAASNDILGPPISEKEMKLSVKSLDTRDLEMEEDPIYSSQYFEGDIVLNSRDQLFQILEGDPEGQLSAVKNHRMTWPNAVIPYVISASFSSWERSVIARAMAEYRAKTCIRLVARTSSHRDYVHILKGQGCSSAVGRVGGVQVLSLGNNCVHFGVILHELMHAAGFWHEQSRFDRDSYVSINWHNILPGMAYNFNKKSQSITMDLGLGYDYSSIMHYGAYAFSRTRGAPTIVVRRPGANIGQRSGFSQVDVQSLNLLYRCSGVGPTTKPSPSSCVDKHQNCPSWATSGQCTSNVAYMATNCRRSCQLCGESSCRDLVVHCAYWAARGECQSNPGYMERQCKSSCNLCDGTGGGCQDKNEFCQDWARKGECKSNPAFMQGSCPKACGTC